ncbi:amino acid ABC transporter substrate-binding protein, PAAT family [Arthrobacter subterraneus]|uniref:Amino acid ABC transporter substrate-binding protein, PAAT family n=1 Tax=Arthrobacter subterraneus TaxID=335973 RepID=A0A1G8GQ17_9MICC|nr:amino acid ABC transporter substrate-binding protein [Arthrobacter subterraneus]SDH96528.1 amino acid ABC transporter substrate-binding protein, PAAT family [Arthrobacter subterraneus]
MISRRLPLLGAATAILLAVAGCGSSASSDTASEGASESTGGTTLAEIQESGVLTVGTEGTYKPFTFHEGGAGELTGYDVEVITAVAEKLGVEAEFEETQWDAIFAGLEAGRFDVIANQVSITPEREETYSFSVPYTYSNGVIVTSADNSEITSFEDLEGKTTAQSLTSNWYELAEESGAEIEAVEGWAQSVTLLEQGRVDATINDELTFLDYQKSTPNENIKIAAETEEQSRSALAFPQGSDDLVEAVNSALEELREDGTLAEISEKYFGEDVSAE